MITQMLFNGIGKNVLIGGAIGVVALLLLNAGRSSSADEVKESLNGVSKKNKAISVGAKKKVGKLSL